MANGRGGYRQPSNPASVSGPGALSKRTDGGATEGMTQAPKYMAGLGYGKGGNMEQQQGAPIAGNDIPAMPAPVVPLTAPTSRPQEPITAGADFGPGPGSEALINMPTPQVNVVNTFRKLAQYDDSGDTELIYRRLLDSTY
jgi:hypothetical protein